MACNTVRAASHSGRTRRPRNFHSAIVERAAHCTLAAGACLLFSTLVFVSAYNAVNRFRCYIICVPFSLTCTECLLSFASHGTAAVLHGAGDDSARRRPTRHLAVAGTAHHAQAPQLDTRATSVALLHPRTSCVGGPSLCDGVRVFFFHTHTSVHMRTHTHDA